MGKLSPRVSVLMSIYKEPSSWIRECIESISRQTLNDFEFIIINDNPLSCDNDLLLQEYVEKDTRIKIVRNKVNIGLTKSLNIGLALASGKYIARMDADDIAMPERLKKQFEFLEDNPDYILCGSFALKINKSSKEVGKFNYLTNDLNIRDALILKNQFNHPTLFYRNLDKLRYKEELKYAQDYDFVINACQYGKVANLNQYLLKYRISGQQIGSSKLREQDFYANKIRLTYIIKILETDYGILSLDNEGIRKIRHEFHLNTKTKISNIYFTLAVYLKKVSLIYRVKDFLFLKVGALQKMRFLVNSF